MHVSLFNSGERVLLIGEGNFSFSVDLADLISLHITATCLESEGISETTKRNVEKLREKGARVFLGIDGTKLCEEPVIGHEQFDKVVLNFPHIGGKMKLGANRTLLGELLCSAAGVLCPGGRVLVSLCRGQGGTPADCPARAWPDTWQAVEMAARADLVLEDVHSFQRQAFPHYCCVGYRGRDVSFQLDGALVHVFRPAGPLLPLAVHPSLPPAGSPARYLSRCLETYLGQRVKVVVPSPQQCGAQPLPALLQRALSLLLHEQQHSELVMAEGLALHSERRGDFSVQPASWQVVLVGQVTPSLCTHFVHHVLTLFHKSQSWSVSQGQGTSSQYLGQQVAGFQIEGENDICTIRNVPDGSGFVVCKEYNVESNGLTLQVYVVCLDRLAQAMFDADNWRELWADGASVQMKELVPSLKRACLYPRQHVLDITFRETCLFALEDFYDALWELAGDVITRVELLNTYQSAEGWRSSCYRITYQSFSRALSRSAAIMVHQLVVGQGLTRKLGVTVF